MIRFFISVFVGVFCLLSFYAWPNTNSQQNDKLKEKDVSIGVSLPTQRDTGWVRYKKAFDALSKSTPGVKVSTQAADQDANAQASIVDNLLVSKIDVLILAPQDAAAAASLVDAAHKVGVKVIALDRLITNAPVDLYISFDNEKVGELQGQYLTSRAETGNYIILSGAPTDNNSKIFLDGAMKYIAPLEKSGKIKIIMKQPIDDWQPAVAQRLVENALTKNNNNVQAILAPNDNTAGGVIEALATQKFAGKRLAGNVFVTGQDAEPAAITRIINGTQSMTVFKDQTKLAEIAYKAAIALARGKTPETTTTITNGQYKVPAYYMTPIVVDKTNVDDVLIKTGVFSRSSIYKGK